MKSVATGFNILVILLFVCFPLFAADDLPAEAKRILSTHCAGCHGKDNSSEGGFGYVLNVPEMISQKKLVPGKSADSKLIKKIMSGQMPPNDEGPNGSASPLPQVTTVDLKLLKAWIDGGTADFNPAPVARAFASESAIFKTIQDDLKTFDATTARSTRYFTLTHLFNAGVTAEELNGYYQGLTKMLNSLSWNAKLSVPVAIDADATIFRIDLRNYNWNHDTWEQILASNPYGIKYKTSAAAYCYKVTGSQAPAVRADWFVFAGSEPKLYHEILGIPKTAAELEKTLGVDVEANIRDGVAARAGFNGSAVSENNRVIERHPLANGSYWKSYDFGSNDGDKNIFSKPLGPVKDGKDKFAFVADGGELIFSLPNGLQAYMLVDAKGNRIEKGPQTIVHDDKAQDRAVANGRSCMSCHAQGMIDKTDEIRRRVGADRTFAIRELKRVQHLYVPSEEMNALLAQDRGRFVGALRILGIDPTKPEPVRNLSKRFEAEMGLALAAAEAGLEAKTFLEYMDRSTEVSRALGNLRTGTVKRELFLKSYKLIVDEFDLGESLQVVTATVAAVKPEVPVQSETFNFYRCNLVKNLEVVSEAKYAIAAQMNMETNGNYFTLPMQMKLDHRQSARIIEANDRGDFTQESLIETSNLHAGATFNGRSLDQDLHSALEGTTVVSKVKDQKVSRKLKFGTPTAEQEALLTKGGISTFALDKFVKVGDSWTVPASEVTDFLGLGEDAQGQCTVNFVRISELDGERCAVLQFKYSPSSGHTKGMGFETAKNIKGFIQVSLSTNIFVKVEMTMDVESSSINLNGVQGNMKGQMTYNEKSAIKRP